MSWFYGKYRCGCEGRIQVYGKDSERQRRADWVFENHECPDCAAKTREEERKKKNAASAEESAKRGLPELQGTGKQIAWANTLRVEQVRLIESVLPSVVDGKRAEATAIMDDWVRAHIKASFWIENRESLRDKQDAGRLIFDEYEKRTGAAKR